MSEPKELSEAELDAIRKWFYGPGTEQFETGEVIAMLLDHIDWQREEECFYYTLNGRLAKILNDTANVLKGAPDELALHSTHDLAKVSERIMSALRNANDLLRSAYQVAQRDGAVTNWAAFAKRLEDELVSESKLLNNTPHVPAATCTPKTFRIPEAQ